jgi:hypothetical protein
MSTAVAVTLTLFAAGVIFAGGRLSARVDALERWRDEMRGEFRELRGGIDDVKRLIRGQRD